MTSKLHSAPQTKSNVFNDGANDENIPVILHPLVVLNVSDHYTRYAALKAFPGASSRNRAGDPNASGLSSMEEDERNARVIGILLGNQMSRCVEICHSFELQASEVNGHTEINQEFMRNRMDQYKQIFANYIVVGWYCVGEEVTEEDNRLHREVFSALNESPILLIMNPKKRSSQEPNPDNMDTNASPSESRPLGYFPRLLTTYEMELKVVQGVPKMMLVPVSHRYASEDSERIAVDHVIRHAFPGSNNGTSSTALHLSTMRRSIKMLQSRMEILVQFLEATLEGKIDVNHSLLRQVAGVCARVPALDCNKFSEAFTEERNDSLIVTYLSGLTKSLCSMHEALEMFNKFSDKTSGPSLASRRKGVLSRQ